MTRFTLTHFNAPESVLQSETFEHANEDRALQKAQKRAVEWAAIMTAGDMLKLDYAD